MRQFLSNLLKINNLRKEFLMDSHRLNLNNQWVNIARLGGVLLLAATAVVILLFGLRMQASAETDVVGIGLVTDGSVDSPWNELSYQGLLRAESELGVVGTVYTPTSSADYESKLQQCVIDGNELCFSVGFLMNEATATTAQLHSNKKFAIVDHWFFDGEGNKVTYDNVKELTFRVDQAAFLAGYVAAGTTQTGKVGTYGGLSIAPVVNFMDGFWYGVQYYNQQNGTNVKVLGWNPETLSGYFTNNFVSFDDGYNMGLQLIGEGADIILPVAGSIVGEGTATAAKDHGSTYIIGVDSDWYDTLSGYGDIILTSVLKKMDVAVFDTIKSVVDGKFKGGLYIGTLENGGVAIAPFHDLENLVPPKVKADLDKVTSGIIDGTITVNHPCGQHIGWMFRLRLCSVNMPIIIR
jgi:basic membrane protein A